MDRNATKILDIWTVNEDCKLKHFKSLTYGELYHMDIANSVFSFVALQKFIIDDSEDLEYLINRAALECL